MKNEEFFQMLDGVEDKYIEKASELLALRQEDREGVLVQAAPRSRGTVWKTVAVSAAATAAVVFGAVFLMRNVGKNGFMLEPASSYDSPGRDGDIGGGNSVTVNSENSSVESADSSAESENSSVQSEDSAVQSADGEDSAPPTDSSSSAPEESSTSSSAEESSVPPEADGEEVTSGESDVSEPEVVNVWHPPLNYVDTGTVYNAVDPVDNRVRFVDFSDTTIHIGRGDPEYPYTIEGSEVSLGYLRDFFGTDDLPFDERYKDNLERVAFNAVYNCKVSEGARAYTPVDGKVVAVNDDYMYHNGWGNAVAIEFEDKVFAIAHLDEVHVKVGDTVTAGQAVGVCGMSGAVYVGDGPTFSMIIMVKLPDRDAS